MSANDLLPPPGPVLRVLAPGSPQAQAIYHLGLETSVILAGIFALVAGAVVAALMRCRWREGEPDPRQYAGNRTIEIVWTAIPGVIVAVLFALTARTMSEADPAPAPEPDLVVTGHQWWWEARYPKSGVVAANEIHMPIGRALSVQLDSADVLHEFWVPELARKITTVPGHPNHIWIEADRAGNLSRLLLGVLRHRARLDALSGRRGAAGAIRGLAAGAAPAGGPAGRDGSGRRARAFSAAPAASAAMRSTAPRRTRASAPTSPTSPAAVSSGRASPTIRRAISGAGWPIRSR